MYDKLTAQKNELEKYLPLPAEIQASVDKETTTELVCVGTFFDGGSFTHKEIDEILYRDKTVSDHALTEHIEALNIAEVYKTVKENALKHAGASLDEKDVKDIHRVIVRALDDKNAGYYRGTELNFINTERALPSPIKVQRMMNDFGMWLYTARLLHPVSLAAEAHLRLLAVQPFARGNFHVARMLMNLILMKHGYPPALFSRREKKEYLCAVENAVFGNSRDGYDKLVVRAVNRALEMYKKAATVQKIDAEDADPYFMRIGQLAKASGERVSALRYWTAMGLLETAGKTSADYVLYSSDVLEKIQRLRKLKNERYTLEEIKNIIQAE